VEIADEALGRVLTECSSSGGHETGGILVGRYDAGHQRAIVTRASLAPTDSQSGTSWFHRGVAGLQRWLDDLWEAERKEYYLGEWHYHPCAVAAPSADDRREMMAIAACEAWRCPEPVLLVVSRAAEREWVMSVHVFPHGCEPLELASYAV
jgi:integrative and conjugative element protein (TIGR02256 family)